MSNLEQAAAAAIAAWERVHSLANYDTFYQRMDALREALAAHKPEPVAVRAEPVAARAEPVAEPVQAAVLESLKAIVEFADAPVEAKRPDVFFMRINNARAAIARAEQAEPVALTVAEIEQMNAQWNYEIHGDRTRYLVRMTEKAHGIKGSV